MSSQPTNYITQLLRDWSDGNTEALEELTPLVYQELHRLAHGYMLNERPGHSLQTTALINEAFIRLIDWKNVEWQSRAHFFGVASRLMRRILVDYARNRNYTKRGGGAVRVSLVDSLIPVISRNEDLIALDEALGCLEEIDPRKCRIVELRFFGGMSIEETAEVLKTSPRTVKRDWSLARAWLHRRLSKNDEL